MALEEFRENYSKRNILECTANEISIDRCFLFHMMNWLKICRLITFLGKHYPKSSEHLNVRGLINYRLTDIVKYVNECTFQIVNIVENPVVKYQELRELSNKCADATETFVPYVVYQPNCMGHTVECLKRTGSESFSHFYAIS